MLTIKLTQIALYATFNMQALKEARELKLGKSKSLLQALNEQTIEAVFDLPKVRQFLHDNCSRVVQLYASLINVPESAASSTVKERASAESLIDITKMTYSLKMIRLSDL